MKTTDNKLRYFEWKNTGKMHQSSIQWLSELSFIRDEQRFFQDMPRKYILPIPESKLFKQVQSLST